MQSADNLKWTPISCRENFMVLSMSWSCIVAALVHIWGCQWGSMSSWWQSWEHIWGGREIISESRLTPSKVWLCVWGKVLLFFVLLVPVCVSSYSALVAKCSRLTDQICLFGKISLVRKNECLKLKVQILHMTKVLWVQRQVTASTCHILASILVTSLFIYTKNNVMTIN